MLGFAPISKKISLLFSGELDKVPCLLDSPSNFTLQVLINLLSGHCETFVDENYFHSKFIHHIPS